jgi:DnaJ-class molecular chaperone
MAQDYYKSLGVPKEASQADIQKAYRDLARKHHPDMNPDNPKAKKKFQEIQAAFDVLNNPEKRELYDRYGSSFETMGQGPPPGGWASAPGAAWSSAPGGFTAEDVDFSQFFGDRFGEGGGADLGDIFTHFRKAAGARGGAKTKRGGDVTSEVTIPFSTAVNGGEVQLGLDRGKGQTETIAVKIPPGIDEGKVMRLRGKGEPAGRGAAGDLLLTIRVAPHPFFTRKGNDLYVRLPVTLGEAVAGGSVDVPTPQGTVALHIPPGTSSGKRLRIKGHGVPAKTATGDLFAEVLIVLPPNMSDFDREAIRAIDAKTPTNPRQNLRW